MTFVGRVSDPVKSHLSKKILGYQILSIFWICEKSPVEVFDFYEKADALVLI